MAKQLAFGGEGYRTRHLKKGMLRKINKYTVTDIKKIRKDLELTRKRGYAVDIQEQKEGVVRISAPIFDNTGNLLAVVTIAGPAFRIKNSLIKKYGEYVKETANLISRELGYNNKHI